MGATLSHKARNEAKSVAKASFKEEEFPPSKASCGYFLPLKNKVNPENLEGLVQKWQKKLANTKSLTLNIDQLFELISSSIDKRKQKWVQISGHKDHFCPTSYNTVWKMHNVPENMEVLAYSAINEEDGDLKKCLPKFYQELQYKGRYFIELEDLLCQFTHPRIMDIKIGLRTFLESEVENIYPRSDLYVKMIKLNPDAPTTEEHREKAVTKLRYMQLRESESTTQSLGFRIDGLKLANSAPVSSKNIKNTEQTINALIAFFKDSNNPQAIKKISNRLAFIMKAFSSSQYGLSRELVGSSILIIIDEHDANAWMIDLSKSPALPENCTLDHYTPWVKGNHEDGYLFGLSNLIKIIDQLEKYIH